jgi:hypothetical protein
MNTNPKDTVADPSPSFGEAQLRVIEVLREQNPEWVDAAGECLPCVPHELELAAAISPPLVQDGGYTANAPGFAV